MNQLKRVAQLEGAERARLLGEIEGIIDGLTDAELEELADGATDDKGRPLSTMPDDEAMEAIAQMQARRSVADLANEMASLKQIVAERRAA